MGFHENLKKLRYINKMRQCDVADLADISRSIISYYELGKANPTLENLNKLANVFGITVELLMSDNLDIYLLENEVKYREKTNKENLEKSNLNKNSVEHLYRIKESYLNELKNLQDQTKEKIIEIYKIEKTIELIENEYK
ncbi:helix-turn-helix transcriptional regulator [Clostridium botulinum]|uniref:Putative phage LexA repressor DNA binding protein n=1 Tax=Clostridium botulinum TaxID=1491 RepID=A0A0A0UZP4_CLOBO|nr:helix-turn-helix domain-containing protein [Clostridium botulinum]AIW54602.1 putative phage LexA repressor DNA binding protein [Clostridium botulinum]AIW54722.1 putative phage LexA repressor DNA binding protein [Clostridium botulinum]AIW54784.1 putative phage LexA repressor DNA binding protein/ Xre family toxin-antitoxin system antitoxin component [Clostridium botulinum]AIW54851.1 putative phage LexA repressor DNA binding protein [Clostridium botulinum]MBY7009277.1 helix-turn-helix transcri